MSNIYDALSKSREGRPAPVSSAAPSAPSPAAPIAPGGASRGTLPDLPEPARDREMEAIRQRILLELGNDPSPSILFTGAVPGEGVTTLAVHFARELARSEQRPVLLVDANLVRGNGSLTGTLENRGEAAPGLTDLLAGRAELAATVLATEEPLLHFLPCGRESGAPLDLVRADRVRRLLDTFATHYGFVIIDAGASLQASETALLAAPTNGVVLVVRANRTRREVIQRAVQVLQRGRCRLLGVVLNDRRYPIPGFLYRRI